MNCFARIDMHHFHAEILRERLHHLLGFVQPQQAVVDEHAGELIADRAMNQRRRHRRIDAARQSEHHLLLADFGTDAADRLVDVTRHVPVATEAADIVHEALDDGLALQRMRDFRMKLHGVEFARFIGHAGNRASLHCSQ